jgi:dTDP-4-dehydrorhamnose reductase
MTSSAKSLFPLKLSLDQDSTLQLWGGLECTVNRVGDRYFSQLERNGHIQRRDDLERFQSLGIRAIRYPILWERTAPNGPAQANWQWADERLGDLQRLGIEPIVGLVHHGSGPPHTNLMDAEFAPQLAEYAHAVAERFPWVLYYTPVNEPLTTARFAGLYGVWYPHGQTDAMFIRALIVQCRATVLSMQAIRQVNPAALLVQTDDLGETTSTEALADVAAFYNHRRWLAWDLLCGMVNPDHALWGYLLHHGVSQIELNWFVENRCPPDIIGVNHYITSERWIDERLDRFPARFHGGYGGRQFADIETARALQRPPAGIGPLLKQTWERYQLPIAITEVHIDAHREDQMRWLVDIWHAALQAREAGIDLRAVTLWALLGSFDWNSLVTVDKGYYEPGPFDVRSSPPRATALAPLARELSMGGSGSHPVLEGRGWWHRHDRWFCEPVQQPVAPITATSEWCLRTHQGWAAPLLIAGGRGTLSQAFGRRCTQRQINHLTVDRARLDITDAKSLAALLKEVHPWAVINACGYVRVDDAEQDAERCYRENTQGAATLAQVCADNGIQLLTFSTDMVFDGTKIDPYIETDEVNPLNVYGASKAEAERQVLEIFKSALVVRTSSFFGPWDAHNWVTLALLAMVKGEPCPVEANCIMSPTYVPDLVDICLDLLIDKENGLWHLTHNQSMTWAELIRTAAQRAGISTRTLKTVLPEDLQWKAPRPPQSALSSLHGRLLPTLESALDRYVLDGAPHWGDAGHRIIGGGRR